MEMQFHFQYTMISFWKCKYNLKWKKIVNLKNVDEYVLF